jgi:ribose transport system substrate-binding protein
MPHIPKGHQVMRKLTLVAIVLFLIASTTIPKPSAAQGKLGSVDDLQVTSDEVTAAQNAIGDSVVGVLACTVKTEYHKAVAMAAIKQLATYGLNADLFDAQLDFNREITAIQSYTQRGAKVLIVCLLDNKVNDALSQAAKQGVQIIQFAGRDADAYGGITISVEDSDLGSTNGQFAGQLIKETLNGKANVAILDYPSVPNVVIRADNIEKALLKEAPDATIVGRFLGGTLDNGYKSTKDALAKYPDINVIASINDAGGLGAMKALQEAGKDPNDVLIVGIDGDPDAKDAILNGQYFRASVDTSPQLTGQLSAQAAVKLLAGTKLAHNDIAVPATLLDKTAIMNEDQSATAEATMEATVAATQVATP